MIADNDGLAGTTYDVASVTPFSRRGFIVSAMAVGLSSIHSPAHAAAPIRVSNLWLKNSRPLSSKLNEVRGTLAFRVNGERSDRTLVAYGSGSDWENSDRQCVELIKRYAGRLGVRGFGAGPGKGDLWRGGPAVGHGKDVAASLAALSDGGLKYQKNGSDQLPRAGSVISFARWGSNPFGHVGILCNHDPNDAKTNIVWIKLFDQNLQRDKWTEVRFVRNGGRWWGELPNSRGTDYYSSSGWASPAG